MTRQLPLAFSPSLDTAVIEKQLRRLIISGKIADPDLARRFHRLELLFGSSLRTSPLPLWAPGLFINQEWRNLTDKFLPWARIAPTLRRMISRSLRYQPSYDPLTPFTSWPDFLQRCSRLTSSSNPSLFLKRLSDDENLRCRWLFTLFLPKEHGGGFDRYPKQQEYLRLWFLKYKNLPDKQLTCMDAACGCGEGSWELAELCRQCGVSPCKIVIHGSSLDQLEIFSAAHASFPHDQQRERAYRTRIAPVIAEGFMDRILFFREDLADSCGSHEKYDLILCNGLLGGPMLNDTLRNAEVITGLIRRLKPGGLFLAADRFHEGWRKRISRQEMEVNLVQCGLKVLDAGEGIGGVKGVKGER